MLRRNLSRAVLILGWWGAYLAVADHTGLFSLYQLCVLIYLFGLAFHNVGAPFPDVMRQLWRQPLSLIAPALVPFLVLGVGLLATGRLTGLVCMGATGVIAWCARLGSAAPASSPHSSISPSESLSEDIPS